MGETNGRPEPKDDRQVQIVRELPPVDRRSFLKVGVVGGTLLTGTVVVGSILEVITRPDGSRVALSKGAVL